MARERTKRKRTYSDVEMVMGIQSETPSLKASMEKALYNLCERYYNENYRALFIVDEKTKEDIFHDTFLILWQNIEKGIVSVKDGVLMGKDGETFKGKLTTYLMDIAKLKYQEWRRKEEKTHPTGRELKSSGEETPSTTPISVIQKDIKRWLLYGNDEQIKLAIISELISQMSERCVEILSRFYYEEMDYSAMIGELPTYSSIDAIKTQKYKCLQRLKALSKERYNQINIII